jgi:hypothetical protein
MAALANPSGRLVYLKRGSKQPKVLLDNLWFSNGIALSPNEDFLIVSDLVRNRILKYWIATDNAGTWEVLVAGLPGSVDNITPDKNGFWAPLVLTTDSGELNIFQKLAPHPWIRKLFVRLMFLTEFVFKKIDTFYSNSFSQNIVKNCQSLSTYSSLFHNSRATVLRFDWNGHVIAAYHSFEDSMYTHVLDFDGKLYLGSLFYDYIARVDRRDHS